MDSTKLRLAERVSTLIEQQRTLAASDDALERVVGSLVVAAQLRQYLACLTDRAIGRLMFRHVWNVLSITSPEMAITIEATRRLLRKEKNKSPKEDK